MADGNLEVDPKYIQQVYQQKLEGMTRENVLLHAAVVQFQDQVTTLAVEKATLQKEVNRLEEMNRDQPQGQGSEQGG